MNLVHVIAEDITERNKMIAELQNAEKLESIGILAGGIAHDFNNLLTGIFGYIDIARSYNSSGSADNVSLNLSKAHDVLNRARALTQQLLTFSKGGAPVKKMLSLQPLLTNTTNFVLSGSAVNARFSFPDNLWPCEVDENQLGQVIDNLVINARQSMPTGGTVVVMAENIPSGQAVPAPLAPGAYVHISIHDFGTGITREHLPPPICSTRSSPPNRKEADSVLLRHIPSSKSTEGQLKPIRAWDWYNNPYLPTCNTFRHHGNNRLRSE